MSGWESARCIFPKMIIDAVDEGRAEWLRSRPWYSEDHVNLQETLSKLAPGTEVVAIPLDPLLAEFFRLWQDESKRCCFVPSFVSSVLPEEEAVTYANMFTPAEYKPMAQSQCHDNCIALAVVYEYEWYTGFALSKDGLWRNHSWCINANHPSGIPTIVETTDERILYVGVKNNL